MKKVDTSIPRRVSIPNTEVRYIRSSIIGDEFKIFIALPADYRSTDTTYPVLYSTDANWWFAASTQIAQLMQFDNELPQIIFVGIGYRTDDQNKILERRTKYLMPKAVYDSVLYGWPTGGAEQFLRFIKEELMPFIKKNYRISADAAYAGCSNGGLFGLYVLFHEPGTFQRYLIGSPSIAYDRLAVLKYEEEYAAKHADLSARVFMSAGELEEQADPGLGGASGWLTNMKQLAEKLLSRRYPSFNLQTVVFDGETHLSGLAASISRGLRVIFQK